MPLAALRATLKDVSQSSDRRKPWNRAKASSKETPLRNSTFSAWNGTMLFIWGHRTTSELYRIVNDVNELMLMVVLVLKRLLIRSDEKSLG